MDSMYGGRPGAPFIIKENFPSIREMEEKFRKGAAYQDVWYGEYCIIDTPNKNDLDNGKIFMRGPDFTKDDGGANYVGQIVGPQSGTPHFSISPWQDVVDQTSRELDVANFENRTYPTASGIFFDNSNDNSDVEVRQDLSLSNASGDLVPGKYEKDGTVSYNDDIRYIWCNIAQPSKEGFPSTMYLGFKVPYSVFEFDAEPVPPYNANGDYDPSSQIRDIKEKEISKDHPYYWSYRIKVPLGVKGDSVRDLRVESIVSTSGDLRYVQSRGNGVSLVYNYSDFVQDQESGTLNPPSRSTYTCPEPTEEQSHKIWVFDLYLYDKKKMPTPYAVYVGDYNVVEGVQLDADGTLTFHFSAQDKTAFNQAIRWVTDASIDTETGRFELRFNNGDPFVSDLRWVKDIRIANDGTVSYDFTCGDDRVASKLIRWIESVTLDESNGHFEVQFNNDKNGPKIYSKDLPWVKDIVIDKDNGTVTVNKTTGTTTYQDMLRWINSVSLSPNGEFKVDFNNGSDYTTTLKWVNGIGYNRNNGVLTATFSDGSSPYVSSIDMVTGMSMNTDGKLSYTTNTGSTVPVNGDNINYIVDMSMDPTDYHLLVLFNDPHRRISLESANAAGIGDNDSVIIDGVRWVRRVKLIDNIITDSNRDSVFWKDFGAIKDQSGVLVGTNVVSAEINPIDPDSVNREDVMSYLNERYPNGAPNGKVITYGDSVDSPKAFYAFDYDALEWYYLGEISDIYSLSAVIADGYDDVSSYKNVITGGVVLIRDRIAYTNAPGNIWYPWAMVPE